MAKRKVPNRRQRLGRKVTLFITEDAPGSYSAEVSGSAGLGKLMDRALRIGLKVVSGQLPTEPWQALQRHTVDSRTVPKDLVDPADELWINDLYTVHRQENEGGWIHLSIKRSDKTRVREWRHLQQIKNELAGPEREAIEIFPAESRLVDSADQYHLWVVPPGAINGVGFQDRLVSHPDDADSWSRNRNVVVDQSPWGEGLTTGQAIDE